MEEEGKEGEREGEMEGGEIEEEGSKCLTRAMLE